MQAAHGTAAQRLQKIALNASRQQGLWRCMASEKGKGSKDPKFKILDEQQMYARYLTMYSRTVQFPAHSDQPEVVHEFDVIGHPQSEFQFAVTFPFHPFKGGRKGGQVTVLKEYCQGVNQMMWVLPTGGYDPRRHLTRLDCARSELSEEAQLSGGEWIPLIDPHHAGIAEVKWCANRFTPYLCIGAEGDTDPGARDKEEFIEVHRIEVAQLRQLMASGDMMLPSISTCFLALERLQTLKLI